jgi:AraC family transcriptional regulator, regulatory protein of adaptative response / methylated-DNA-[protein]-cysteine methyltransferase
MDPRPSPQDMARSLLSLADQGESAHRALREAFPAAAAGRGLHTALLRTKLGPMVAAATEDAICFLEFADRRAYAAQVATLARRLPLSLRPGENDLLRFLREELAAYFQGRIARFTVPLLAPGSPFQERVWAGLARIPYGATLSYEELAARAGSPGAARAAGAANGMNRLAILLPCHRVVGKGGQLTGYAGGLWRKHLLLELERQMHPEATSPAPIP